MTNIGMRSAYGVAATPFTMGPYTWDQNLTMNSNLTVTGNLEVDGNFTFGDATTDTLTMDGLLSWAGGQAYTPLRLGVKSNESSKGHVLVGSTDNTGGFQLFCDDGNATLGSITTPLWTRYLIYKSAQGSGGPTATGAYIQTKSLAATYTTGSYTALKAFYQAGGAMTLAGGAELSVINAGISYEGDMTVSSGQLTGIDINVNDGTHTIGTSSALIIRKVSASTLGWTNGIKINDAGAVTGISIGTCTTGINITSATTQAIYANVTAVNNTGSLTGGALCIYGAGQAGKNDVGIVAYLDATAKGQSTGNWTYGMGAWLNIDTSFIYSSGGWGGHEQLTPLNVGIYSPASGPSISDCDAIYGIKAEFVGDTAAPTTHGCYFAALNVSQTAATRTAIFFAHQGASVGLGANKTVQSGSIALCDVNGTMYYVNVYSS